jgi:hypothetical protein
MRQKRLTEQGVSKKDIVAFAKHAKKNKRKTVKKVSVSQ